MLLLFVACYLPAGVVVGALRLEPVPAIPVIIGLSLAAATALGSLLVIRKSFTPRDFGLAPCTGAQTMLALVAGMLIGLAAMAAGGHVADPRLQELQELPIWQTALLFWLGASVQEELVFRGLLQSVVARALGEAGSRPVGIISGAAIAVGVLFGAVHLPLGAWAACLALLLGILAGELRARTGSVIPPIVAHASCNLLGSLDRFL